MPSTERNISIVTLPLWGNYGGLLQAYALHQACSHIGVKPMCHQSFLNFRKREPRSFSKKFAGLKERLRLLFNPAKTTPPCVWDQLIDRTESFITRHLPETYLVQETDVSAIQRFVVGSDQVWRCAYAKKRSSPSFYFLDFATPDQRRMSFAYAASFGADEWEGNPQETARCKELLQEFKSVSVREFSGIDICRDTFGVTPVRMPDPTFLLERKSYEQLIRSEHTRRPGQKYFASYVLDGSAETALLMEQISKDTQLYHQRLMPTPDATRGRDRFFVSVEQWLRYMRDCEIVITDSFHGCVFSIIFNKPFVCLGNADRGSARFETLFRIFDVQQRLVQKQTVNNVIKTLHLPIDWERINFTLEKERQLGLNFLKTNILD